ncbi:DUF2914 domain-containing protein [Salinisphaera sp.]|uniref:DUF2914 domain-containing protein n=1 Tax=Salinisphaera sp. TaxID=1914330 RepID=UPI002D7A08DB|nr:DUF2914 domain-containing protein [Salinisphaera sp.]HET7315567.1 DUF2914 domain-containing protein [Salinisphaera sp.]
MSKRKPRSSRSGFIRAYFVPALLWLGILVVAWVSVSELSVDRPATDQGQKPATSDPQQRHEPGSSPPKPAGHDNDREAIAQRPAPQSQISASAKQDKSTPQTDTTSSVAPRQKRAAGPVAESDANDTQPRHEPATARTSDAQNPAQPSGSGPSASPESSGHVARAQLTTGIENKEPVDRITGAFHSRHQPRRYLYYFTEVKGLSGETVTHRWWHEGLLMSKVTLPIGSNSWRTYSAQKLTPSMTGAWQVVATDSQGHILSSTRFVYETP